MRILLLGATGRLGGRLLEEALARGHAVTALVRQPALWGAAHERLTVVPGDVRDAEAVARAMIGQDAVASALGAARGREQHDVLAVGMANMVAAMKQAGIRRIVAVASAGILQRDAHSLRRDAPGYPETFRRASAAHMQAYEHLLASGLDWTMLCPAELEEGEAGPFVVQPDYLPEGPKRIRMASAAGYLVDALEQGLAVRQRIGILDQP